MRKTPLGVALLVALATAAAPLAAQRPLSVEAGLFGQFTFFDKNLNLDNTVTGGGRLTLFLLSGFAGEADIQFGQTDWQNGGTTESITLRPWAARVIWTAPFSEKWKGIVGVGYQQNVFEGRTRLVGATVAPNEYEDAFTALLGLKYCLNDKWHLRGDVVADHDPSPNFNSDPPSAVNGTATNWGIRLGFGTMLRGECGGRVGWSLGVTPKTATIKRNATQQFTVAAQDLKARAIDWSRVRNARWTSSNVGVATVDSSGMARAVAPGTTTITVCGTYYRQEHCDTANLEVSKPEWSVAVTGGGTTDYRGTRQLSATANNEFNEAVTGTWTWTSSDPSIATVDNNGLVTCVGVNGGNVTITATLRDAAGDTRSGTQQVTCNRQPRVARQVLELKSVHFRFNRSGLVDLTRRGRDTLDYVKRLAADSSEWSLVIEGHTDPYGTQAYNEGLAQDRANTVLNYLTSGDNAISSGRVQARALGERCLVFDDDSDRPRLPKNPTGRGANQRPNHEQNRRVEIWTIGDEGVPTGCRPGAIEKTPQR
jgi:outer membrane protein OmpA-like peptidoglycan-associated protein